MAGRLYIDLGNSRIKWMHDQGGISTVSALEYSADLLYQQLTEAWDDIVQPESVWLASVARCEVYDNLLHWLADHWKIIPSVMTVASEACGLRCGYRQPRQLGVDRWAALIAAHAIYPDGVCVVDCGTAITVDAVDAHGQHLGGFILPGISAMQRTLLQETAIELKATAVDAGLEWGNSTISGIELGTRKAVVALVEQTIERMQAGGICDPGLILTGGKAASIEPLMEIEYQRRDTLVLEGIKLYSGEKSK